MTSSIEAKPAPRRVRLLGPAIILLAAAVATAPLILSGPACGSDLGFHLVSWIDAQHSMTMGVLYPHWANSANFGAGEPRFVFYPPLSWMAGAFLGLFLSWTAVPVALFWTLLAANGLAIRALARQALADGPATLAGCASMFLGYPLFSVYKRCDFAELAAEACIPLLLLYALRRRNRSGNLWQRAFDGSAAPLALLMAVTWLCNGPVGLMACYLLAAVALVSAALEKSLAPVVRAAISTGLGLLLASVYLVPAVVEKKWASIEYATTLSHFTIENSWLFARHDDVSMYAHDMLLHRVSRIAVEMLAIAFFCGATCWLRKKMPGKSRWWIPLALIPVAVLILLFPISEPVWNTLPALRLLQFPWRWLVVLEIPVAIFFAAAVWFDGRKARIAALALCSLLFVGISLRAHAVWFADCSGTESSVLQMIQRGMGTLGRPEYAPPNVQFAMVDRMVHGACLLDAPAESMPQNASTAPSWDAEGKDCNSDFRALTSLPEQKRFIGAAGHAGYLILRLRYYPAWRVTVNGKPVAAVAERQRGFIAVPVAAGPVQVDVEWTTTPDVVAGRWLTAIAIALIAALIALERKLKTK